MKKIISKNKRKNNLLNINELKNLSDKNLIKYLRKFRTDLNYDLRKPLYPRTKGKVRQIREILISMMRVRNPYFFHPRKNHRKATQEYLDLSNKWKAFIIGKDKNEIIYFKNGKLRIKSKYIDKRKGKFNFDDLINNPKKEIERIINAEKFDVVKLEAGENFIGGNKKENVEARDYADGNKNKNLIVDELLEDVNNLMSKYDNQQADNFYQNWMFGIELIELKNQKKGGNFKRKIANKKIGKSINRKKGKNKNDKTPNSRRGL